MKEARESGDRIALLDSFRFLAIVSVLLFHYYSCWLPSKNRLDLYPYGEQFNYFSYGYLGVQFFFIISGFVIANTLFSTKNVSEFWKRRLIRLFPPMVLCTILTFFCCIILDDANLFADSKKWLNIFYSISFINPKLLDIVLQPFNIKGTYINYSYWSLWPEIQFYFLSSLIYFMNPRRFISNFSWLCFFLYFVNWLFINIQGRNIFHIPASEQIIQGYQFIFKEIFTIPSNILWFLLGIYFYQLYKGANWRNIYPFFVIALVLQFYSCVQWPVRFAMIGMVGLFFLFLYKPNLLRFLNNRMISTIGLASYTLYLIHENIGVLLIHKFGGYFGKYSFLYPLLVLILFSCFSLASYFYFEKPFGKKLRKAFL